MDVIVEQSPEMSIGTPFTLQPYFFCALGRLILSENRDASNFL